MTPSLRLAAAVSDRRREDQGELGLGFARSGGHYRTPKRGTASGGLLHGWGGSPSHGGSGSGVGRLYATTTTPGAGGGGGGAPPGGSEEGQLSSEEGAPALEVSAAVAGGGESALICMPLCVVGVSSP